MENSESAEKRIGLVIGQLSQGGAERQITRLAIELSTRSVYRPVVFCLSTYVDPYGSELTEANIEWYSPPDHLKSSLARLMWLIRCVKATRCDLLYSFLNIGNIYAGVTALVLRLPFIASIRSANSAFSPVIKTLARLFYQRADLIIANSASCIQILENDLRILHQHTVIIPNIISTICTSDEARQRLRTQWGVTDEPVIGTIALIKRSKRPKLFVDTVAAPQYQIARTFCMGR